MTNHFNNSSMLIFGATGGIGSALVRQLAPLGCRLTLAARDPQRLAALAEEVQCDSSAGDATNSAAVDACVAAVIEKHGRLDGVVNCVGLLLLKPAHATSDEDWAGVLALERSQESCSGGLQERANKTSGFQKNTATSFLRML